MTASVAVKATSFMMVDKIAACVVDKFAACVVAKFAAFLVAKFAACVVAMTASVAVKATSMMARDKFAACVAKFAAFLVAMTASVAVKATSMMARLTYVMESMLEARSAFMLAVPMGSGTRTRKMTKPRSVLFPKKGFPKQGLPLLTIDFFNFIKYLFYDLSFLPSMVATIVFAVLILCLTQLQEDQAEQQRGDEKLHTTFRSETN